MSVISEAELRELVEVVWMTVLDLPIGSSDGQGLSTSKCLTADISIGGAWQGVVSVRASEQFLTHAASLMFSCATDTVTDSDRTDTLTELTNMLGGTVKCLLPEICDLSLPVIEESEADGDVAEREWINFCCDTKPLAVAVTEHAEGAQQAA